MITIDNKKVTDITIGNKVVSRIVDQETDEVIFEKTAPQQNEYFYIENTYNGTNTVTLTTTSHLSPPSSYYSDTVEYSKDKNTWTTVTFNTSTPTTISMSAGEKVYFRNDNGKWNHYGSGEYVTTFTASQSHNVGGNINSLLNYQNMNGVSLKIYCFLELFLNDTTLVDAGSLVLPTTTLIRHCYYSMFEGCSSLTTAPALPATTLANGCYEQMFRDCSYLTTIPQTLPATTLAQSCYQSMFERCSRLTSAPALPATTLAKYCYEYMFSGCSRLASAPALQATTLANYCYTYMFANCTSLTTAPELPATTLAEYCYSNMFSGCSSLNTVTVYANNNSAANCTVSWLKNVAASGTFNNRGSAVYTTGSASGIPTGWTEMGGGCFHIKNRYNGTNTITVNVRQNGTPTSGTYATSVEYSKNGSTWTTLDLSSTGTKTISMSSGDTVYFRNSSGHWSWFESTQNRRFISLYCSQNFDVGGHLSSLVDYTNLNVTVPQGSFHLLFYISDSTSTKLIDSSKLIMPSNLGMYSLMGTFRGCTLMTSVPELPATTLAANCYQWLFYNCSSITTAPELPATTLVNNCYRQMYYNCSSLTSVTVYADDNSATGCTTNWLDGVAASGTFNNLGSATYTADSASGIPTGWTEVKS